MPKPLSPFPRRSCASLGFDQDLDGIPPSLIMSFVTAFLVHSDIREGTIQCGHFPFSPRSAHCHRTVGD